MVEKPGYPDTIVYWDLRTDAMEVPIPYLDRSLILHSRNFSFVSSDSIALAGHVDQSFVNVNAGRLKFFSLQDPSQNNATVMQTGDVNAEIGTIRRSVAYQDYQDPVISFYTAIHRGIFDEDSSEQNFLASYWHHFW
ncbi:hypothetical protein CVT25_013247 [Psilocybe cyanescens]|uniref:Uncharacterized protein n=1 Tax=Psilocybe cyanescens TaxID=93625 RepID=A0A409X0Q0_PSICY|nr:hypothetical protein CVT25_013247 [Psilocybe cyanescens]